MQDLKQYLTESAVNIEEVKKGMVSFLNEVLNANQGNPISVTLGKTVIANVVAAKVMNLPSAGIHPYSDIELIQNNANTKRISIRRYTGKKFDARNIPIMESPGIDLLEKIYPNIRKDFLSSLLNYYTEKKGISHGEPVPLAYGLLPTKIKEKVLVGSSEIGGRADYILCVRRSPFTFKSIRIPLMTVKSLPTGVSVSLSKMDAEIYTAEEVLKNNDVYVYMGGSEGKTLYLATDMVDRYNFPVIVGPSGVRMGNSAKDYGGQLRMITNIKISKRDFFTVDSTHHRTFDLELKPKHKLGADSTQSALDAHDKRQGGHRTPSYHHNPMSGDEYSPGEESENKTSLIQTVIHNFGRGLTQTGRTLEDYEDYLNSALENEKIENLVAYSQMPPHRLVNTIIQRHLSEFVYSS